MRPIALLFAGFFSSCTLFTGFLFLPCGNGVTEPGEQCDDGNDASGDGCNSECQAESFCGDGTQGAAEECDDGNNADGDGCSSICTNEGVCGDGVLDVGEVCDDGNTIAGDGCRANCDGIEVCGDGTLQPSLGEACDDGGLNNGDGCDLSCQLEQFAETERNDDGAPNTDGLLDTTGAENVIVGDDFSAANANGPFTNALISASFEPIGDEDVFEVFNPNVTDVKLAVETSTTVDFSTCIAVDTGINLRNQNGVLLASDDDIEGISVCSRIKDFLLAPGDSVFVHITVFRDNEQHGGYFLSIVSAIQ